MKMTKEMFIRIGLDNGWLPVHTQADLARRWRINSRQSVSKWSLEDEHFPEPIWRVNNNKTSLYCEADIRAYEKLRGLK